ncbi:hypothetical protein C1645_739907 [Glomus cerebriforme]|uniref:Uncharacterized protein n=1 Tax=Glomus cerebriforme TaxID=658196 RepID=A0A397SXR0_9GLOM|nr:hypothetical protein C1645_739907 [Glomus cerebriforme]
MLQSELSDFLDVPALFYPEAEKDKMEGQMIRYSGEDYLNYISSCDDIVAENNKELTAILEDALSKQQDIPFMTIDIEESTKFINDEESIDVFEVKTRGILSNAIKSFEIEHIKAFSFRDYHTEKKPYLRIYTVNTKQRKIVMKAIQKKKYITASDDQFTYYRKVARECGILLSGWSMISKYVCESGGRNNPLCAYTFWVSIENFRPVEDLASLKN